MTKHTAAFFDLDKTLISRSSTLAFSRPFYRHGLISRGTMIRGTFAQAVFKRAGDKIVRVADTSFSPGDDFCNVWHLFDLIPEGAGGWQPKFGYAN